MMRGALGAIPSKYEGLTRSRCIVMAYERAIKYLVIFEPFLSLQGTLVRQKSFYRKNYFIKIQNSFTPRLLQVVESFGRRG